VPIVVSGRGVLADGLEPARSAPRNLSSTFCGLLQSFFAKDGELGSNRVPVWHNPRAARWPCSRSLEDSASLPEPHLLAQEIADDLRTALAQIEDVVGDLEQRVDARAREAMPT
jgi:hypothetical protein